ncbi:autotransporter outer membrane beta-barrel domain-containing protein [Microvirga sp. GCM10011540]|uniref:autotransporter family protein n=1 Tax=Microvirga sp. GCM10011540 TaxID=3317338 RepID=UPI0036133641
MTGWTSVADYLGWIDQHNALRQVRAQAGGHVWSDRSAWSDTATGSGAVPNNRDGHFRGAGAIGRYYQVALTQPGTMTLDMNATIDSLWIGGEQSALSLPRGRELAAMLGTELSDGRLAVDGTLSTGLLDISGGTLSGTGRIVTPFGVANKGGVVAPGSATAPGVLTVQGRYVQTDMGILAIRVRDGDSSRLSVEQTATLGGTLHVSGRVDPLHQNTTAQVLTAGAVEGRFARVTDSFAFFDPSLTYGSRAVTMNLARNGLAFADIGLTGNERAAGAAAEALAPTHQVYGAILQLDETSARGAFGNLAGDIHASARGVLLDTSRYVRDAATNRMRQTFTGDGSLASLSAPPGTVQTPHGTTVGLWGQGFGSWGRNTDRAHAGIDTSTGGFLLGADSLAGDGWRVGIAGGYSQTSFDTDRTVSSGTSDNYHVAAYGGRQWGPLGVRLGSALSWHSIGVNRQVVFPGFSDTLVSDRDGRTAQIFGEVGYGLALGTAALEPFAALAHVNLHTDGLTETGGAAALNARGGSANTTFSTLGVRVANRIALSETTALTVRGTLGWRHAFGDVEPAALMTFQDGAFPFGVTGAPVARDALVVEAGLDLAVGPAATLGVSYSGQISGRTQDQTVKGDLTWKF